MNNRSGYYDIIGCLLNCNTRCFNNTKDKIQLFTAHDGPFDQKAISILTISYIKITTVNIVLLISEAGNYLAIYTHIIVLKIDIT